jgi:hypothetical protein
VSLNKRNDQVSEELLRTYKILKRLELNLETKNNLKIKNITELPKTSNLFKKKFSLDITSNNQDFTFVLYQLNPTPDEDSPLGISANEKDAAMIILTDTFNNLKTLLQERLRRRLENSSGNHPTEL